jgi:uncharacterized membrane protein
MKWTAQAVTRSLLVVVSAAFATVLYPRLPDPVPTHWNASGAADGFTPKPWGAFLMPLVMAGVALLLAVLPRISPRGFALSPFARVYDVLQTAVVAFLAFVNAIALLTAAGVGLSMERWIFAGTGLLLAVVGNFLGKITKNFFVGVRTPWTLASDEVWLRTHRLAGKLFVVAGFVVFASSVAGGSVPLLIAPIALAAIVSVVASFIFYRRIEGFRGDP